LALAHRDLLGAGDAFPALDHLGLAAIFVLGAVDPDALGARRRAAGVGARVARVLAAMREERLNLATLPVDQADQLAVVHRAGLAHFASLVNRTRLHARDHDRLRDGAVLGDLRLDVLGHAARLDRRNLRILRDITRTRLLDVLGAIGRVGL